MSQPPRHNHAHDFVCPFQNLMHPQIPQHPFQGIVFQITIPTVELQGLIHDIETSIGCKSFCHGGMLGGIIGVVLLSMYLPIFSMADTVSS